MQSDSPRSLASEKPRGPLVGFIAGSLALGLLASASAGASATWTRIVSGHVGSETTASALAVAPGGQIAVATEGGVRWQNRTGTESLDAGSSRASLPDVTDLAFGRDGALLIGTRLGLFTWSPGGRPSSHSLRGGEDAMRILRIVRRGDAIAVATAAGAYWSSSGSIFQRLDSGAPRETSLVTMRSGRRSEATLAEAAEVFTYGESGLIRFHGVLARSGLRVLGRDSIDLPRPRSEAAPVDLAIDDRAVATRGASLVMLYPDAIAVRPLPPLADSAPASGTWRLVRPVLGPGAQMHRLVLGKDRILIASNRGLFAAASLGETLERVTGPFGVESCEDLDGSDSIGWIVQCRSGVYASGAIVEATARFTPRDREEKGAVARSVVPALPPDPPLSAIRARALARAGLTPSRGEALWAGLRRRGLWPDVSLRIGADFARDDRKVSDEAFVSGDYRHLNDRTRDRGSGYDATLELDWSLGELAYPDDSVNLSRELRQVIALRDDISDEIHQLYFERQRLRERLTASPPLTTEEASALRIRAEEIGAGLDAWTDGWLSRWRQELLSDVPVVRTHPRLTVP